MQCFKCKREIEENEKFCSFCEISGCPTPLPSAKYLKISGMVGIVYFTIWLILWGLSFANALRHELPLAYLIRYLMVIVPMGFLLYTSCEISRQCSKPEKAKILSILSIISLGLSLASFFIGLFIRFVPSSSLQNFFLIVIPIIYVAGTLEHKIIYDRLR